MRFNFEKNLVHQSNAVSATVSVFDDLPIAKPKEFDKQFINPLIDKSGAKYARNIRLARSEYGVHDGRIKYDSNIIDIMMETGTGKTYTYTKSIYELNKLYGIFKFVIVVPTLSIKAGTVDFLKSESSREHFKEQYGKTLRLHIVESQKGGKSKKSHLPPAVNSFVNAGAFEKNHIQVLIINAGMINSETMQKSFDTSIFDKYSVPFDAISATRSFVIIDEPHKFPQANITWENIKKMKPQFIIRYGATFLEHENLIYTLTAVDSFNRNLVKGVITHIKGFASGENAIVRFINSDGTEATFELTENNKKHTVKLTKKESFEKIHSAMKDLFIEALKINKVNLSNGLELKKGNAINPYSYSETLQETMIADAIAKHFELEKQLLNREVKIKPLTLFFIDNIEEYRNADGFLKKTVELYIKAQAEKLLKTETDSFYKNYLEKTLVDISKTHGGYFSRDNNEKDEAIEQEVIEILHDKQTMLSLDNPRRFIFSKWTLREGWDNPNVFQICKLRSSGSDVSKLQEVGRGLRLPVNQYGNRVKDEEFYLNYFVDITEIDFAKKLVDEVNAKSGAISSEQVVTKLDENMIKQILEKYPNLYRDEEELLKKLEDAGVISRTNDFKEGGFDYIKLSYPLIFKGVGSNKIRNATDEKKKISIRTEKYSELKDLWEKLNQKVVLEYKFENEACFQNLIVGFFKNNVSLFTQDGLVYSQRRLAIEDGQAVVSEEISIQENVLIKISTMKYYDFIKHLSQDLNINIKTLHKAFIEAEVKINDYLNISTIRRLKQEFDMYLLNNAIGAFGIEYQKVTNTFHPTKITDTSGEIKNEISASEVGILYSDEAVASNYLFDKLFYDSDLEKDNIRTTIAEVVVFTKIPKNSIKIPVAGGKSYSPDFAYVLKNENGGSKLLFIVETKNANESSLRDEEKQKIRHAEVFFGDAVKIKFKKQFINKNISDLIKEITRL
ncbi:MAG: type III restriction-modification system endonuclease [Methylacidiphilales bacterium]|nr:type III restriction-modification system endonuclease [Candidatus Methylacidiphilales bacterium]